MSDKGARTAQKTSCEHVFIYHLLPWVAAVFVVFLGLPFR